MDFHRKWSEAQENQRCGVVDVAVTEIPEGRRLEWSVRRLSDELGVARETIQKRIAEHNVRPTGQRSGHPTYRMVDIVAALYGASTFDEDGGFDPNKLKPTERRAWFQSELDRMAVEERAARLIPAGEVEEQMAAIVSTVVRCLETQADRAERDLRVGPEVVEWLLKDADQVREQIADALTGDEDEDALRVSG